MHFRCELLCKTLNQYEKIIIYGTGNYAQEIYPHLLKHGLKDKILCFAQTEVNSTELIDGIQVVNINTLTDYREKCVVLIAVSKLYTNEIKLTLLDYGYLNIVSFIDYEIQHKVTKKNFCELTSFHEQCEYIADWYTKTQFGKLSKDKVLCELLRRGEAKNNKQDVNLIVMICGHISARTIKIVGALKIKKYNIVMLNYCEKENIWCIEELYKQKIQIEICYRIEEMLYKALQYNPLVYFFEPLWGDCSWVEIMLKNKQYYGKIVLGLYDVINEQYIGLPECNYRTEKYALEHADGIVWRWFSKESLTEKGFIYRGKSIQFLDYCRMISNHDATNEISSSIIRLCAVVSHGDEYVDNREYFTNYTDFARLEEILLKIGNRQDCIFHFFAGDLSDRNIKRCKEYQKKYKNFKFFLSTEYSDLLKKLENYDFGCELWIGGEEPPNDAIVGEYLGSNYWNCVRNTYFDFIEAGLPIITTLSPRLWEHLAVYDIVIRMTLDDLDIDYLKQNKQQYKANVEEARKELDIDKHIDNLIQFFKKV